MGFLDPKQQDDEDEALPGAAGLHLDLDLKRCPACRREVSPWQETCPDCGAAPVAATEVPGASFPLPPGLLDAPGHGGGDAEVGGDRRDGDDPSDDG